MAVLLQPLPLCSVDRGARAAALAALLSMWNLCSPGAADRVTWRWRYEKLQKCSKLAAGCVTGSKELRFASNQAAPQAASVAKILAAKRRVHQGKTRPFAPSPRLEKTHTLPRVDVVPATATRGRHGEVGRDLARREPRQILDEVQPGVELGPARVEEIRNQTGAGLRFIFP